MPDKHKWEFKARFRRNAYGWKGTALASRRLREATSEIKKVSRKDPVLAADGAVALMERLWPALQGIDTSWGSLGIAVLHALDELIGVLIDAPAGIETRRAWLERLYEAVEEDGVQYLNPVEERWGEICVFPELVNGWADRVMPLLRFCWSDERPGGFVVGTDICLSCLLEAERYDELEGLLRLRKISMWHYDKFWAEALARMGRPDEAIEYASAMLEGHYSHHQIREFCEKTLIEAGRAEEAYAEFGILLRSGNTYLSSYRALVRKYPDMDPRAILVDLIDTSENKGAWFASARKAGFPDIARDCAREGVVEPKTLIRAARESGESDPSFSFELALRALDLLLQGHGYETTTADVSEGFEILMKSATGMGVPDWAVSGIEDLLGRKPANFDDVSARALKAMLDRYLRECAPDGDICGDGA